MQADWSISPACTEERIRKHGGKRLSTTPRREPRSHAVSQPMDQTSGNQGSRNWEKVSWLCSQKRLQRVLSFQGRERSGERVPRQAESLHPGSYRPARPQPLVANCLIPEPLRGDLGPALANLPAPAEELQTCFPPSPTRGYSQLFRGRDVTGLSSLGFGFWSSSSAWTLRDSS